MKVWVEVEMFDYATDVRGLRGGWDAGAGLWITLSAWVAQTLRLRVTVIERWKMVQR